MLEQTSETFSLEQIVDKKTRENNILDLIFTNVPKALETSSVRNISPLSDHNLVKSKYTIEVQGNEEVQAKSQRSVATKINFRAIDKEAYARELDRIN